ncbi:hypothetical protein QAD02_006444 [Eretmocerus hayati]|uniref:Uncharacterized protein n=1 Tax=Eretmocerus hayati TaxID=131215 RepID=A0ACC2N389_9HYME|nr:hypothetical protein QAD02_006444 [Eretmocerus hayati]
MAKKIFPLIATLIPILVSASSQNLQDQIGVRDWSDKNDTQIFIADPPIPKLGKLVYAFCKKQAKKNVKLCEFHLESYESEDDKSTYCTSEFHSPTPTVVPDFMQPTTLNLIDNENKIVVGYYDIRNNTLALVIRLIDVAKNCKSHRDLVISPVSQKALIYRVISYNDRLDVFYIRDRKIANNSEETIPYKVTFNIDGEQMGNHVPILAYIPNEQIYSSIIDAAFSLLNQLHPVIYNGIARNYSSDYFFLSNKLDQIKVVASDGLVKRTKKIKFEDWRLSPYGNNSLALIEKLQGNTVNIVHINEKLEIVQEIALETSQNRSLHGLFAYSPKEILVISGDNPDNTSENNFYLERFEKGQRSQLINIGKLHFQDNSWKSHFFLTYPTGRICVNALSFIHRYTSVKGLKFKCILEDDIGISR